MPELPDLQVFGTSLKKFKKGLEKAKVADVYREGKEVRFKFDNGNIMALNL